MRVIIIEDEIRIRKGIEKLVYKIAENNEIVAYAENGEEGLEAVLILNPDIVITDIRMPKMDGLEMLTKIKERRGELPRTIVISAYSEFEYARQAIRLGVSEYILKPISVVEFTNIFKKIEKQIQMEKERDKLQMERESFESIIRSLLLEEKNVSVHEKKILLNRFQYNTQQESCIILAYMTNEGLRKKLRKNLENVWKMCEKVCVEFIDLQQEKSLLIFLYNYTESSYLERWFQKRVATDFAYEYGNNVCFGWGVIQTIDNLSETYEQIRKSMDWNLILGKGVIVSFPKVEKIQTEPVIYPILIEQEMRESLCMIENKKIKKSEQKFLKYFQDGVIHLPEEVKKAFVRFIWAMLSIVKEINIRCYEEFQQPIILNRIMKAVTYEELEDSLHEVIKIIETYGDDIIEESMIIKKMKNMVHEFYNQGITLEEIATELQMTPEYIGTQFRKEVGCTYSTYLKKYRIEKAKKLLIGTDMKTYVIAQKVGYSDSKYFSKVFKEVVGVLPGEFKKRN